VTAARSATTRRIARIFEVGEYRVKRWVRTWEKIGPAAHIQASPRPE
jgi:transposase